MDSICHNCGEITDKNICPRCRAAIEIPTFGPEGMTKAMKAVRYGYNCRREAEKYRPDTRYHYAAPLPNDIQTWFAEFILSNHTLDEAREFAKRLVPLAEQRYKKTSNPDYEQALHILKNEVSLKLFFQYIKDYQEGMLEVPEETKKYIQNEMWADMYAYYMTSPQYQTLNKDIRSEISKELANQNDYNFYPVGTLQYYTEMQPKLPLIFVSHASKDREMVTAFVEGILKGGLGLQNQQIAYTSEECTGVPTSGDIPEFMRNKMDEAAISLVMLSDNYRSSEVCMMEYGAITLTKDKKYALVVLPGYGADSIGWVNGHTKALFIAEEDKLDSLIEKISEDMCVQTSLSRINQSKKEFYERLNCFSVSNDNNSVEELVRLVKSLISQTETDIQLHELFQKEIDEAVSAISSRVYSNEYLNGHLFNEAWRHAIDSIDRLLRISLVLVQWEKSEHHEILITAMRKVVRTLFPEVSSYRDFTMQLNMLPCIIYGYALGTCCVVHKKYRLLSQLWSVRYIDRNRNRNFFWYKVCHCQIWDKKMVNEWIGKGYRMPFSTYLRETIATYFPELEDEEQVDYFSIYEYLNALNFYLHSLDDEIHRDWFPLGEYAGNVSIHVVRRTGLDEFRDEVDKQQNEHEIFQSGLFDVGYDRYDTSSKAHDTFLRSVSTSILYA